MLPRAPDDGSLPTRDFGSYLASECFVPRSVYPMMIAHVTDTSTGHVPSSACAIFSDDSSSGNIALYGTPHGNLELALLCDGVAPTNVYDTLETTAGQERAIGMMARGKEPNCLGDEGSESPELCF